MILQSPSPKTFFVSQNDEDTLELRRDLAKQIFQLSYHGHMSPEYVSFLEVSERNYMYQLLVDQLNAEKKAHEEAEKKAKSGMGRIPSHPRR